MADIAAAAGKDHTGTVRHIQHTDCEIKIPRRYGDDAGNLTKVHYALQCTSII